LLVAFAAERWKFLRQVLQLKWLRAVGSPVSEVLDCWALLTLPQTNSSAAITARNNPLLNFIEFSPSAYGCLEDLTHSFASCRGGLDRL
jgi:hypothetical protein